MVKAKQQELFPEEAAPEAKPKRKRARGCVVCDRKLDPDAKLSACLSPPEEWREWVCASCARAYEKRLERPPVGKPGAVLGAIEWASSRTWSFARHFLTPREVVRAGVPTSRTLKELRRELQRENEALKDAAFTRGVLAAADIAEQFDNESANPSRVSDIVRCKLNAVRLAKPRRNAAHNNSFAQGVALALADLNRKFDQPSMVADVLEDTGLTIKQLRAAGVEEHDLRELKKCLRKQQRSHADAVERHDTRR